MSARGCARVCCKGLLLSALLSYPASAQEHTGDIPRLGDGRPDLQGTWEYSTTIPLERPLDNSERQLENVSIPPRHWQSAHGLHPEYSESAIPFNEPFPENGLPGDPTGSRRDSLITAPDNGRIPALTAQARSRAQALRQAAGRNVGVEAQPLTDRCLIGSNAGPPMIPGPGGNLVQIVQAGDHVVVHNESVHSVRIVRLGAMEHRSIPRRWEGDSIGRWEGNMLIVETTDFAATTAFPHASDRMVLEEKFWLIDASSMGYEFTVSDPHTWVAPWTARFAMRRTTTSIREHACHEENNDLAEIMARGRRLELEPGAGLDREPEVDSVP